MSNPQNKHLRDHCWLWCHQPGSHNGQYKLPVDSTITPEEASAFMGIDRLIFVGVQNKPLPPFKPHAEPMRHAKSLVWSIIGGCSSTRNNHETDLEPVLALKPDFPNLSGAIMDDFFNAKGTGDDLARWNVEATKGFRKKLNDASLDLWVVAYDQILDHPVEPWLEACDVITYWTWKAKNLSKLEDNFARLEKKAPNQRKVLGIYMWDYGGEAPMPMETMKKQVAIGQRLLNEGRIESVIFLASNLCDLNVDTVLYVKELLAKD